MRWAQKRRPDWLLAISLWGFWMAQATPGCAAEEIRVIELQGTMLVSTAPGADWILTQTNQLLRSGYRVRTGPNSRALLRWSDRSVVSVKQRTELEILPSHDPEAQYGLHLWGGIFSFFHRDQPGRIRVISRGVLAAVRGTEFVMALDTADVVERVTLSVIDGRVEPSWIQSKADAARSVPPAERQSR